MSRLTVVLCPPPFQNEKLAQLTAKLDQFTSMNKKHDLLDMELEEAEARSVFEGLPWKHF
jgi:hypothetical protein